MKTASLSLPLNKVHLLACVSVFFSSDSPPESEHSKHISQNVKPFILPLQNQYRCLRGTVYLFSLKNIWAASPKMFHLSKGNLKTPSLKKKMDWMLFLSVCMWIFSTVWLYCCIWAYWLGSVTACACSVSVCVCARGCWSWQLLIVLLISGLQFLADKHKLSLTLRFLSFSLSPIFVLFFFFFTLSCWSSSISLSPFSVPFTPAVIPFNLSFPSRSSYSCISSVCFAPSSTRLPSIFFLFFLLLLFYRICFALSSTCPAFATLPLTSAHPHLDLLCFSLISFPPCKHCFSFCLTYFFPHSAHFFFFMIDFPHLLFLSQLHPHHIFFAVILSLFFILLSTSSYLFCFALSSSLSLVILNSVFHSPFVIFFSSCSLKSFSLPLRVCLFLCLPPFPLSFVFFPCCVLMQNGMFYTSYVSTYLCLVRLNELLSNFYYVLPASLSLSSSSSLSTSPPAFFLLLWNTCRWRIRLFCFFQFPQITLSPRCYRANALCQLCKQ